MNSEFEKLGFTSADTEAAFTRLDRASGSAAIAYKEMGVAADLAAAKNISFQQAALLIGKVIDGNTQRPQPLRDRDPERHRPRSTRWLSRIRSWPVRLQLRPHR